MFVVQNRKERFVYEDSNTYVLPHIHLEDYPGFKPAGTINPNIYAVHNEETS